MTIKVLIIEDSKLMQNILQKALLSDSDIEIVGIADDPLIARDIIKKYNPDVITLDIILPHMDGITFLKNLMRLHPLPVVMVSSLTEKGSAIALDALAYGAVDYLVKPKFKEANDLTLFTHKLLRAVKTASTANVKKSLIPVAMSKSFINTITDMRLLKNHVIAIGASTGGIEAIETILFQLPKIFPPIVIVQHIRKEFSSSFAKRMGKVSGLLVSEVIEKCEILPGHIYIAPGDMHLIIHKENGKYYAMINSNPPFNRHRPSVDVLFSSVAEAAGSYGIGVLLTGMGNDGAIGLKAMRNAKARTIAQDQASSIVWGMPGSAVKLDAAEYIVSLRDIPHMIMQMIDQKMFGEKIS